jgi:hypothetical protein
MANRMIGFASYCAHDEPIEFSTFDGQSDHRLRLAPIAAARVDFVTAALGDWRERRGARTGRFMRVGIPACLGEGVGNTECESQLRLQSYLRPLVWSAHAPGHDGSRARGANRDSDLSGPSGLSALPSRRSEPVRHQCRVPRSLG